jgi:hypothetical protein
VVLSRKPSLSSQTRSNMRGLQVRPMRANARQHNGLLTRAFGPLKRNAWIKAAVGNMPRSSKIRRGIHTGLEKSHVIFLRFQGLGPWRPFVRTMSAIPTLAHSRASSRRAKTQLEQL